LRIDEGLNFHEEEERRVLIITLDKEAVYMKNLGFEMKKNCHKLIKAIRPEAYHTVVI